MRSLLLRGAIRPPLECKMQDRSQVIRHRREHGLGQWHLFVKPFPVSNFILVVDSLRMDNSVAKVAKCRAIHSSDGRINHGIAKRDACAFPFPDRNHLTNEREEQHRSVKYLHVRGGFYREDLSPRRVGNRQGGLSTQHGVENALCSNQHPAQHNMYFDKSLEVHTLGLPLSRSLGSRHGSESI
jgi:hypothetical protein